MKKWSIDVELDAMNAQIWRGEKKGNI
jgi:hypothetical protein